MADEMGLGKTVCSGNVFVLTVTNLSSYNVSRLCGRY